MKRYLFAFLLLISYTLVYSQIRIDKQQCFGGFGPDFATGIVEYDGFFLITGQVDTISCGTGHVPQCQGPTWLVKINTDYEIIDSWTYYMGGRSIFKAQYENDNYNYLVGMGRCYGAKNLQTIKIDADGNEIWSRCFGNEYGLVSATGQLYTSDGCVINAGDYIMDGGDVSHIFGAYDGWVIKMDSLGNLLWEVTLGSEGINEGVCSVQQASDEGYYVCMQNESFGEGNVVCGTPQGWNATLVKLSQRRFGMARMLWL